MNLKSHQEPLINLKVGPQEEEVVFLIDTGVTRASLNFIPWGLKISNQKLRISGVKGEGFLGPIYETTSLRFGNEKVQG